MELFNTLFAITLSLTQHAQVQPPPVHMVTHDWLQQHCCEGKPTRVLGWYHDGAVYLDRRVDMDKLACRAMVVHEFVHYLQEIDGGKCPGWYSCEAQAYDVQQRFMTLYGHVDHVGFVFSTGQPCETR